MIKKCKFIKEQEVRGLLLGPNSPLILPNKIRSSLKRSIGPDLCDYYISTYGLHIRKSSQSLHN